MNFWGYEIINGYRSDKPKGYYDPIRHHTGIDVGCPIGTPLPLPWDTECVEARKQNEMGSCIYLEDRLFGVTVLAHLSEFKVKKGDKVPAGTIVGLSGNTGKISTGPHCHLEVICRKPEKGGEEMYRRELSPFVGFNVDPVKYWNKMSKIAGWQRMSNKMRVLYARIVGKVHVKRIK